MDLETIASGVAKNAPGAIGAFVALGFLRGRSWWHSASSFVGGCACSVFGAEHASRLTGADSGLAGFVLGLFGMALVAKLHETITELKLAAALERLISRKEDRP